MGSLLAFLGDAKVMDGIRQIAPGLTPVSSGIQLNSPVEGQLTAGTTQVGGGSLGSPGVIALLSQLLDMLEQLSSQWSGLQNGTPSASPDGGAPAQGGALYGGQPSTLGSGASACPAAAQQGAAEGLPTSSVVGGAPSGEATGQPASSLVSGAPSGGAVNAGSNAQSPTAIGPNDNVLVIGDSYLNTAFGSQLDQDLRSTGAQVELVGSGDATAGSFLNGTATDAGLTTIGPDGQSSYQQDANTPTLQSLINKYHPNTVIVELGENIRNQPPAQAEQQIQQLEATAKQDGTRLIWVSGPPTQKDVQSDGTFTDDYNRTFGDFQNFLQNAVGPDAAFINSADVAPSLQYDSTGVHLTPQASTEWANALFNVLQKG